jgi:hypothetical protein
LPQKLKLDSLRALGLPILGLMLLLFCPFVRAEDKDISNDLVLVQLSINGKLNYDSEILVIDNKVYLPVRQIGDLVDIDINFDRDNRKLTFTEKENNSNVIISLTDKTIQVGNSILDSQANKIFSVKRSIFLNEDALVSNELLDKLFAIKCVFSPDDSLVNIKVERPIKLFKKKLVFKDDDLQEKVLVKPTKKKVEIRTLQTSYSTILSSQQTTTAGQSTTNNNIGSFLNTDFIGEVGGGKYRIGPSWNYNNGSVALTGLKQSLQKSINSKTAYILGDSVLQMNRLNVPSADLLGFNIGSPKNLKFNVVDNLSFEGACEPSSEVNLLLNEQRIARQVCKGGHYNFQNIPRLINPNNNYKIVQKSTDGTETVLRQEVLAFYSDLLPVKEKRWQAFVGRPTLINGVTLIKNNRSTTFLDPASKVIAGSQFQYGLTKRLSLEAAVSADPLYKRPDNPTPLFLSFSKNSQFKPLLSDQYYVSGMTSSFALSARPRDNLGVRWGNALSQSRDISPGKVFRSGVGVASFFDYDWRGKKFSSQGGLFYLSPNFYSLGNLNSQNTMGANFSMGGGFGKQTVNFSASKNFRNIDRKSFGGQIEQTRAAFSHTVKPRPNTFVQHSLSLNEIKNDQSGQRQLIGRSSVRQRINRRFDVTAKTSYIRQDVFKPASFTNTQKEATIGGTYRIGKTLRNQVSFGTGYQFLDGPSFLIKKRQTYYLEGRFARKNIVYQPSLQLARGEDKEASFVLSNGLFWQKNDGTRLGIEYIYSNFELLPLGDNFISLGGTKTTNHNLVLTLFSTIGVLDKKPHLLANSLLAGYLKGRVFWDKNQNGVKDPGEIGIKDAKITFLNKPLKTDANGEFVLVDVARGEYEAQLDTLSLPPTLTPANDSFNFEIAPGKVTDLNFTVTLNSATVSGQLKIKDIDNNSKPAGNIVVIAINSETGKETSYTYTDDNGFFTLSELPPGKYTITLDKNDLAQRHLELVEKTKQINIPAKIDEFIEIANVNFQATQTVFGGE